MERWTDITAAAEEAHGIVTRDELLGAGLSDRRISHWTADGRLVRVGVGVYRIGGVRATFQSEVLAAIKVFVIHTWASHHTTVRLHGVRLSSREQRVQLIRPIELSAQRSIARVHRSNLIPAHHVTVIDGIPATTLARGFFDVARSTGTSALLRAVDAGLMRGGCTIGGIYRVMYDLGGRGRPGTRRMRATLEALGEGYVAPESELEIVGRALLAGLGFAWQVELSDERGYIRRVDGLHRGAGLVLELDGAQHRRDPQRSLDRDGDRRLARLGFTVVRLDWSDVTVQGSATRALVASRVVGAAA